MNEEIKTKVKDLPETERAELIKQMELAGCLGNCGEYKVETAKSKIEEWQKANRSTEENSGNESEAQGRSVPVACSSQAPCTPANAKQKEQEAQNATVSDMAPVNTTPPQEGRSGLGRSLMSASSVAANTAEQKNFDLPGIEVLQNQAGQKKKICHICRSEVINGVCTGCGFRL